MPVTLRASSLATNTTDPFAAAGPTLALGATAQTGDVVFAAFAVTANETVTSVVDNNANAFTLLATVQNGGAFLTGWIYFRRVASGTVTSVTATLGGTVGSPSAFTVGAFVGMADSSIAGNTATDITDTGATHATGNVTTTVADGLLLALLAGDSARTVSTADPDYTVVTAFSTGWFFGVDYRILSATETNNHTLTMSAAMNSAHILGELHGAASVGEVTPALLVIRKA